MVVRGADDDDVVERTGDARGDDGSVNASATRRRTHGTHEDGGEDEETQDVDGARRSKDDVLANAREHDARVGTGERHDGERGRGEDEVGGGARRRRRRGGDTDVGEPKRGCVARGGASRSPTTSPLARWAAMRARVSSGSMSR